MKIYDSTTQEIHEALMKDYRTADMVIEVINEHGIITLHGDVPSLDIALAAEQIVSVQSGVTKVINGLRINGKKAKNF